MVSPWSTPRGAAPAATSPATAISAVSRTRHKRFRPATHSLPFVAAERARYRHESTSRCPSSIRPDATPGARATAVPMGRGALGFSYVGDRAAAHRLRVARRPGGRSIVRRVPCPHRDVPRQAPANGPTHVRRNLTRQRSAARREADSFVLRSPRRRRLRLLSYPRRGRPAGPVPARCDRAPLPSLRHSLPRARLGGSRHPLNGQVVCRDVAAQAHLLSESGFAKPLLRESPPHG